MAEEVDMGIGLDAYFEPTNTLGEFRTATKQSLHIFHYVLYRREKLIDLPGSLKNIFRRALSK